MKTIEETVACVMDYGSFVGLADAMGRRCKKVYYHSPFEQEYLCVQRCVVGDGAERFTRLDEPLDPDRLREIDLFLFPDIGMGGLQRHLRHDCGKLVWGHMGLSDLELYRTRFIQMLRKLGLPVVNSVSIRGVTALAEHLKGVENKWIKINRYRENCETWKHQDFEHSRGELERLAFVFGPLKDIVPMFVVQDEIEGDEDEPVLEIGYDGWSVDGEFPPASFQGYEKKNELYLGSLLPYEEQPEEIRVVNKAFAPVLSEAGYRNFWATEILVKAARAHFIDPTTRQAGQTMEHLYNTCKNLPEVILAGARGEVLTPVFDANFAAEATLHYKAANKGENWQTVRIPEEAEKWVSGYHYCVADGAWHIAEHGTDEIGVISGIGDSVQGSIDGLNENFDALADEPVEIHTAGFADLIEQIQDAQKEGLKFTDGPVPKPAAVIESASSS